MLVLTRAVNETICIGDDIRVTVLEVHRDRVRIGIEAPPKVVVDREEIFDIKREGEKREDES